jgi:LCP family protein required for cell wall assembly
MAPEEKPYRVYKGGRVKGKVPTARKERVQPPRDRKRSGGGNRFRGPGALRLKLPKRLPWRRIVVLGLLIFFVLVVVWAIASYFAFSSGVSDANKRLDAHAHAALAKQSGLLLSHSTTILVLGTDNAPIAQRAGFRHSDSIMLVRTDPKHHRLAYLSIPRDLVVYVPGVGTTKINAAMQAGGPSLAIRVVRDVTGLPINHVVVVNFTDFEGLIDALGGVTIDVPRPILSDRFDCPFKTNTRCQEWQGWRFHKGPQHMDGRRALIYSRVRVNRLDARETDFTRQARQQAVTQAVLSKFTSFGTLLGAPFNASSWVKPITTDLTASQLVQLGWVKFRSSTGSTLHCQLGADLGPGGTGGASEDNPLTIAMFLGRSAPQLPTTTFGPGCARGHGLG